jgi:hypothetical protein
MFFDLGFLILACLETWLIMKPNIIEAIKMIVKKYMITNLSIWWPSSGVRVNVMGPPKKLTISILLHILSQKGYLASGG